jgi:peptide/nickel transport system permease protein
MYQLMISDATPELTSAPSLGSTFFKKLRSIATSFIVRRLLKAIFTVFVVVSLTFGIVRLMPGNPIETYTFELVSQYNMSYQEARDQAAALMDVDLDAPIYVQYFDYLGKLLQGDLGTSFRSKGTTVVSYIKQFLPWTIFSVGTALLISFTLGVTLGMLMAYRRESWIDHILSTVASLASSVPNYLIAIMLIVVFGVQLKWFNVTKMRGSISPGIEPGFTWVFISDAFYHAALPITVYVLTTVGTWMLSMKSSTVQTLEEDYVTVARARGLSDGRIMTSYVGRNAALPLFTQLAISIGFVVGGSILIEQMFVYQGIGQQLFKAINARDYAVMQGIFLVITVSVVLANLMADLLYGVLDPRIRTGGKE